MHGTEIFAAAHARGVMVAFEAAVAGGIPIIKALREGLTANRIEWIAGIINGTTNFILSEMRDKGLDFDVALKEAQRLGYAEADPTFDIEGVDAAHKATIMSAIAFGIPVQFDKAYVEGITKLRRAGHPLRRAAGLPHQAAGHHQAHARKGIELRVHPTLVPAKRLIANVEGAMNAVMVQGDAVGTTLYYGKGAGSEPTASAVIADLVDITRLHTADAAHRVPHLAFQPDAMSDTPILPMSEVVTSYYLRLRVADQAGVLAQGHRPAGRRRHQHRRACCSASQQPAEGATADRPDHPDARPCAKARMNEVIAQMQALPTVLAPIIRIRKEELRLMLYLSHARPCRTASSFCEILLEGLAPDGGLYLPERYPQVDAATLATLARPAVRGARVRDPVALHRRHPGRRPAARSAARPTPRTCSARTQIVPLKQLEDGVYLEAPVQRPDAGLQGHGDAAAGQPVRVRTGAPRRRAEHPGRDLGRHRQRGRIRDARQEGRARLHDLAARPHEPVPAGADVQPAGRQHPQPRDRGRVRRLPGHRQGGVQRPGVQAQVPHRHRQLDQLGAAGGAGRLLLRRLLPGHAARNDADRSSFAVPSGNFGNICAGHVARMMGLPIEQLVLATNENDVLDEFFRTGIYRVRGSADTHETSSPSMDICKASNFERFVFDLLGPRRARACSDLFGERAVARTAAST